jgi:flagellin
MANIGATTAFYKVETSLTRSNNEVSKSMERLATGKQNANAGDRSSYVAMADTFRLDFVGTKAGIKGGSVVLGYLETGMRVLDAASGLVSRIQELAVLGANDTNTPEDAAAIDAEANALSKELHRLLDEATYKGKEVFNASGAFQDVVSLGGRGAEMSFGMGDITTTTAYTDLVNLTVEGTVGSTDYKDVGYLEVAPSEAATTDELTGLLEAFQGKINTARVAAGSLCCAGKCYKLYYRLNCAV